jgi:predicted amidophosphoribosyltransferase
MSRKGQSKGPHRRTPKPSVYAGPTTCLRCEETFQSWDRRQNRLCPRCRHELDQVPSEEPHLRFHPPRRRSGNQDDG